MFFKRIYPKSVYMQIVVLMLVCIITPVASISFIINDKFSDVIERNALSSLEGVLVHAKQNITEFMISMEDALLVIMMDEQIRKRLYQETVDFHEQLAFEEQLKKYLFELNIRQIGAREIAVIDREGQKFQMGTSILPYSKYSDESWSKPIDERNGAPYWGRVDENGRYLYAARKVREYNKTTKFFDKLGMIYFLFEEKDIAQLHTLVKSVEGTNITIIDDAGYVISSSNRELVNKQLTQDALSRLSEDKLDNIHFTNGLFDNDESLLVVHDPIARSDWSIIVSLPWDAVASEVQSIKAVIIVIAAICIAAALVTAIGLAYRVTLPLKRLSKDVKTKMMGGDFSFKSSPEVYPMDEISEIGQGYYRLISHLNDIKDRMLQAEVLKREAELETMKSQINPHFLYNSLESIRMLAVVNKDLATAEMIRSLGYMYRCMISGSSDETTLDEELKYLQSYVNLQRLRYGERLRIEWEISNHTRNAIIPKLTLQPLVENSIKHGIDGKRGAGLIRITARTCKQGVKIQIWDDGAGISAGKLQQLECQLASEQQEGDGIGLYNVHRRINAFFGDSFGLTITSEHGVFTNICILIPGVDSHA